MAKPSRFDALKREIVKEFLDYDPVTGFLTWRPRDRKWFPTDRAWKTWNTKNSGKRAGSFRSNRYGYRQREISLFGLAHSEHKVVWMYMLGDNFPPEIDHINRDATDNRWCNLRASTRQRNSCNQSRRADNTSGVTGVTWNKQTSKWLAQCWFNKQHYYLGRFSDLSDAKNAVSVFRKRVGFDPGHGMIRSKLT